MPWNAPQLWNQQKGVLHVLELIYQYHSKQEHRFVAPFFASARR